MTAPREIRVTLRRLRRAWFLSTVTVTTLAVGIAASTIVAAIAGRLLQAPLPGARADRLVVVSPAFTSWEQFDAWAQGARTVEAVSAYTQRGANVDTGAVSERLLVGRVTREFLVLLGFRPVLGRAFAEEEFDPGHGNVVLVTDGFWRRHYNRSLAVVGRTLAIDGQLYSVVGVLPPWFRTLAEMTPGRVRGWSGGPALLVPLTGNPFVVDRLGSDRWWDGLTAIGKLRADSGLDLARRDLASLSARVPVVRALEHQYALTPLGAKVREPLAIPLAIAGGAVSILLLVACANVASVLLVLGEGRRSEMAVRAALGATAGQLIRASVSETVALIAAGSACGLLAAWGGLGVVRAVAGSMLTGFDSLAIDLRTLAFATALTLVCGLALGMTPAVRALRARDVRNLNLYPHGVAVGPSFVARAVMVSEVGLALALGIAASVLNADFARYLGTDLGFRTGGVLTAETALSRRYDGKAATAFGVELLTRLRGLPEVQMAALAIRNPGTPAAAGTFVGIEGLHEEEMVDGNIVSEDYFAVLSIPVLVGRSFGSSDTLGAEPVAVVNKAFAERYWPTMTGALNRHIFLAPRNSPRIVGVVGDVRRVDTPAQVRPEVYLPYRQSRGERGLVALLRARRGDGSRQSGALADVVRGLDPNQPLFAVSTLEHLVSAQAVGRRLFVGIMSVFAVLTLLLSGAGVVGVTSYGVAAQARELAVRRALGGTVFSTLWLVVWRSMRLVLSGIAVSLPLTWGLIAYFASELVGVTDVDWARYAEGVTAVALVGLMASVIPAWRVMRIDPSVALRDE